MRIVVTGIGVVCAIGINCEETRLALLNEQSGIGPMHYLQSVHQLPVGEVKYTNEQLRSLAGIGNQPMPRSSLLGLIAAQEALKQANLQPDSDMAFISGTTVGGMDLTEQYWNEYHEGRHTETIALHEAGESTLAIARELGSFGFITTPSTACSSALNSIMVGADMLRTGQIKRALVGGCESLSRFHFNGFRTLMILDSEPCRPFDSTRAGLNLGEGAGYLVIEDEADAIARGAQILAYVGGYANTCDAFHQTASSENGEGAYLAMSKAIQMAKLQPQDIDYINAHGTATPNNDLSESAALIRLFGSQMPAISSTKAFTGHTTSASGGLEAAFCVMALREGFVPANLRWAHTAEGLIQPTPHTMRQPLHHVLCNAFGFGGNESSLVLCDQAVDLSVANIQQGKMQQVVSVEHIAPEEITALVSAAEARRMTVQTRQLVAVARKALRLAGIEMPDAILCATQWGCMQQSMRFLLDMLQTNEQELKPTPFIQSTHNTIASMIAIQTGNHGYNITYAQGGESYASAVQDVTNQMALGRIRTALILEFDESVPEWDEVLEQINSKTQNIARAHVFNYQS